MLRSVLGRNAHIGKPVEVQTLWLNALWIGSHFSGRWNELFEKGKVSFEVRFWNELARALRRCRLRSSAWRQRLLSAS